MFCNVLHRRLAKLWSKQRRVESCLRPCKQLLLRPLRWVHGPENQNLYIYISLIKIYCILSESHQNCTLLHLDAFGLLWPIILNIFPRVKSLFLCTVSALPSHPHKEPPESQEN
jgi:hypothetical protein